MYVTLSSVSIRDARGMALGVFEPGIGLAIFRALGCGEKMREACEAVEVDYAGESPNGDDPRSTAIVLVREALARARKEDGP